MMDAPLFSGNEGACASGLVSVLDLPLAEVGRILSAASTLSAEPPARRARRLAYRTVALLFYEASTRTRTSFELAAKSLGAQTTLVSALSSSIEKGESLKDTGLNLKALGAEAIVIRHPNSGAAELLARLTGLPVLNAGDGMHEHPSQALLDLRTLLFATGKATARRTPRTGGKTLAGLTVTICGDILHSRVARSNALLLSRLGARVLLCGPPELLPDFAAELLPRRRLRDLYGESPSGSIEVQRDFSMCLESSHAVMMLRIQRERLSRLKLDLAAYVEHFQLNASRLPLLSASVAPFGVKTGRKIVMHPGPLVRGLEITSEVADGPGSVILDQVTHGLAVRRALLVRALLPGKALA